MEPNVDIVGLYAHNASRSSGKGSRLMMTKGKVAQTCDRMKPKWGQVCPKNMNRKEPFRNSRWWNCDYRSYVARTECAFIGRGGEVYDSDRVFAAHGVGFKSEGFLPENAPVGGYHDVVAHHIFAIYPTATGHFFNQLARLFYLLVALPPDVPILVPHFDLSVKLREILVKSGVMHPQKFIMFPSTTRKGSPGLEFKPHFARWCTSRASRGSAPGRTQLCAPPRRRRRRRVRGLGGPP